MEIENSRAVLAFLSIVVLASGCAHTANNTDSGPTSSLKIENFTAFPSDPFSGQDVRLQLQTINLGEHDAEDVSAELYNVPFDGENSWSFREGDGQWVDQGVVRSADPDADLPARTQNIRWALTAPNLDSDLDIPYNFRTRIYYKYRSVGTSTLTLMDQETYREEGSSGRPVIDNSASPVNLEIRTRTPIVYEGGGSEMCIIARNEGEGTAFLHEEAYQDPEYEIGDENANKVLVSVPDQANVDFSSEEEVDSEENTVEVNLIGGEGIACYEIDVSNAGSQDRLEVPVRIDADYGYVKDASQEVTVRGSDRFN